MLFTDNHFILFVILVFFLFCFSSDVVVSQKAIFYLQVSWLKQHSAPTAGVSFSPSNDKVSYLVTLILLV